MTNTTTTTLKAKILEVLESMDNYALMSVFNEYDPNLYIAGMDEFDELNDGMKPWDLARACFYGDFRPCDEFWRWNAYGNIDSTDYIADWIDLEEIAAYCAEHEDALYCDEIQEAIDEYNDELEESEDEDFESEETA